MILKPHDQKILYAVGSGAYGIELVKLLKRLTDEEQRISSIPADLPPDQLAAQVAGRGLFAKVVGELTAAMEHEPRDNRGHKGMSAEDYE